MYRQLHTFHKNSFFCPTSTFYHSFICRNASNSSSNPGGGIPGDIVCHLRDVGVSLQHGRKLFKDINIGFLNGAKIGVLGSNGCGKSTLMKVIAGIHSDFDGERWCRPGLRVGYLAQEPELDPSKDVRGNIMDGLKESQELLQKFEEVSLKMGEPDADFDSLMEEQSKLQEKIEDLNCWDLSYEVDRVMEALRVPPGDSDVNILSGGERRRVALCRLLLEKPDMLLLDEPTNHLDATSVSWLENFLNSYKGTVISITHDRYFLDNVAGWIFEIERGDTYVYEGNYSKFLKKKQDRLNMDRVKDASQARQLKEELTWIMKHQGGKKGNKARMKQIEVNREQRQQEQHRHRSEGQIIIPTGPRLGERVITAKSIKKAYDGRTLLNGVSFVIEPKSVVGVIGPNGAGKSTLFNILAGLDTPDQGEIVLGESVRLGLVSQNRAELNPKHSVFEAISQGNDHVEVAGRVVNAREYLASFNIRGTSQEKKVGSLSGGERNRVHLARELMRGNNVLMLDEPTNDLDVDTLRSLELALRDFEGASVVVSHDRWFLNRICTHILAFEGNGKVYFHKGNYADYAEDRGIAMVE